MSRSDANTSSSRRFNARATASAFVAAAFVAFGAGLGASFALTIGDTAPVAAITSAQRIATRRIAGRPGRTALTHGGGERAVVRTCADSMPHGLPGRGSRVLRRHRGRGRGGGDACAGGSQHARRLLAVEQEREQQQRRHVCLLAVGEPAGRAGEQPVVGRVAGDAERRPLADGVEASRRRGPARGFGAGTVARTPAAPLPRACGRRTRRGTR